MHNVRFTLSSTIIHAGIFETRMKGTTGVRRQRGTYAGGSWLRPDRTGRQKTGEYRRKVTIFPQPSQLTAESINLCGNFRQEPNAERSGYYISPVEVSEGVVYPLADTAETLMAVFSRT